MMISQPAGLAGNPRSLSVSDLALVGEISLLLDGCRGLDGSEAVLSCLRARTAADVAELFLTMPGHGEVVLVSHDGADSEAFFQRDRFPSGEGFPGIVLDTGAVITTATLDAEREFLRSRVKTLGYTSAVCVPIVCGEEVSGCIFLASKRAPPAGGPPARAALLASLPLAAAVEAARSRARAAARGDPGDDTIRKLREGLRTLTFADDVRVRLYERIRSSEDTSESESGPTNEAPCPARDSGQIQVRGARSGWPGACLQSRCLCRARYCLPLRADDGVFGVVSVAFERTAPLPLTCRLPAALWVTEGISLAALPFPRSGEEVQGRPDRDERCRLQIRCLGGFEVRVDGRLVRASDFDRSKAYELLARLVWAAGRPTTACDLGRALWPDADPTLLRNRLHVTLSALRRVIEPPSRRRGDWCHVRTDGGRYYLDPESPVYVDLWNFDALLRQIVAPNPSSGPTTTAYQPLERAARLYEGGAFAGAFEAEWALTASRRLHDRWLAARSRMSRSGPDVGPTAPS